MRLIAPSPTLVGTSSTRRSVPDWLLPPDLALYLEAKKAGAIRPFLLVRGNDCSLASAELGSSFGAGRSSSSTRAMGALSPFLNPFFRMRKYPPLGLA